jgi:HTH-type transcriptional regulator/antitoxin HigA
MKKTGEVIDNRYFELVRKFPLKSLASEKELDQAIEIVNTLVDRGFESLTPGEDAYLDVLSDLVEKYENEHYPVEDPSAEDMLKFQIEQRSTNQRAVALGAGIAISTISEVLAGRRKLNLDHIQKLAKFFDVEPALFIPREKKAPKVAQSRRVGAKR